MVEWVVTVPVASRFGSRTGFVSSSGNAVTAVSKAAKFRRRVAADYIAVLYHGSVVSLSVGRSGRERGAQRRAASRPALS